MNEEVLKWYEEALGYPMPFRPRELKASAWMLRNGYTLQDIQNCYQHLKAQPFYLGRHLSLRKVQEEIGAWKQTQPSAGDDREAYLKEYRRRWGLLPWEELDRKTGEITEVKR